MHLNYLRFLLSMAVVLVLCTRFPVNLFKILPWTSLWSSYLSSTRITHILFGSVVVTESTDLLSVSVKEEAINVLLVFFTVTAL